jgi:hypothetical protein
MPALTVPPEAAPSMIMGCLTLFVSLYTLTYPHQPILTALHLLLAIPALYFFWTHAFGAIITPNAGVDIGLAVEGLYRRVLESCFVGVGDMYPPVWVNIKTGEKLPLPRMVGGRVAYTFDLLTLIWGTSWWKGFVWDWTTGTVITTQPSEEEGRSHFLKCSLISFIIQHFVMDIFDYILQLAATNPSLPDPISTCILPMHIQCLYAFVLCGLTALTITVPATYILIICVSLGSSPSCWPPMFDSPFEATSLVDFWTNRWHAIF